MKAKEVMKMAVKMAKKMEGDWIARMALALKAAWAIAKKGSSIVLKSYTAKEWKNYGKHRLYIEGDMNVLVDNFGNIVARKVNFKGYYDFDEKCFVRQSGKGNYREEIFEAMRSIVKMKGVVA